MIAIYTCLLFLYRCLLQLASIIVPKAKLLLEGQRQSDTALSQWLGSLEEQREIIWMHCASLGEFEQGRPVLEALRKNFPKHHLLLSFYSPSGFEVRKNTPLADLVVYLPPDYPNKMKQWVQWIDPKLFIVVKYELWPNLFLALKEREVCVYLISGIFREGHRYFGWASFFWAGSRGFFLDDFPHPSPGGGKDSPTGTGLEWRMDQGGPGPGGRGRGGFRP